MGSIVSNGKGKKEQDTTTKLSVLSQNKYQGKARNNSDEVPMHNFTAYQR